MDLFSTIENKCRSIYNYLKIAEIEKMMKYIVGLIIFILFCFVVLMMLKNYEGN